MGAEPITERAKLFAWDMETKTKIQEWELEQEVFGEKVPIISGLTVGPDGLIWGVTNGFVFAFNPTTYKIVKSRNIYPEVNDFGRWRPIKIYFGSDNLLYTNVGDNLTVINPKTMESKLIEEKVALFTLTNENHIYFAQGAKVFKKLAEKPTNLSLSVPEFFSIGRPQDFNVTVDFYGWTIDVTNQTTIVSSNPEIAKIEDGKIIPIKPGRFTIEVTYMGETLPPQEIAINFVPNSGFEEISGNKISGWSLLNGKDSLFSSAEKFYHGERSLKLVDKNTKGKTVIQSSLIPIQSNQEYTAGTWLYIDAKNKNNIRVESNSLLEVRFFDEKGKEIRNTESINKEIDVALEQWFNVEVNGLAPKNAKYVRFILKGYYGWIDEEYYDEVYFFQ